MKCTTCGEFTLWRCPQIIPCNPTWQQRAFGFYKTSTGKNLFCYKCCGERDDWRAWSLAMRQQAIVNKCCCRQCIEAGAAYIQSLSLCIHTEPNCTSSVATLSAPPAAAFGAAIPPPPPQTLPASPRPYHNGFANYSHALPARPAAVIGVAIPPPPPQTLAASTPPTPSPPAAASGAAIPPPPPRTLPASTPPYHNGFANYSDALPAPPAAVSGVAIPPPPPQTPSASPRPYHNGFANCSHALPAPPEAVSGVGSPPPPPQKLPASTPPIPSPLAPVASDTPASAVRRVVVKPYNGLELDDSRGQIEYGYLQVSVGDEVDVLCPTIPGHRGNSFAEYTYVRNSRVGGFGWIPTMVLSTTAVLTTYEGTLPGPIPAGFTLSLQ